MLTVLRQITQEVSQTSDLGQALEKAVKRIKESIHTQACSIFLIDDLSEQFVLVATNGLNQKAINHVKFPIDQGLVGLVGRRAEPINLEDAPNHPSFYAEPIVKEGKFQAFLGVPIIHRRQLLGVLIVQQEEARRFDEDEEAFLVTLCAQFAGILTHAKSTGALTQLIYPQQQLLSNSTMVSGIPGVSGVAMGRAVVIYPPTNLDAVPEREITDIEQEIVLFKQAVASTQTEIKRLRSRLENTVAEDELALFDVYLRMLDYVNLGSEVENEIKTGQWAQGALKKIIQQHIRHFSDMEDEYLKERAEDIKDLGLRVLANLQKSQQTESSFSDDAKSVSITGVILLFL